MRRLFGRLLRALVTSAGIVTVVSSGPSCGGGGGEGKCGSQQKVATSTAQVSGSVTIDTGTDDPISAPVTTTADASGGWRCVASASGRVARRPDDESPLVLSTTAKITCDHERPGLVTHVWTFDVPLGDLRLTSFEASRPVAIDVHDGSPQLNTACYGRLNATLATKVVNARGGEAPGPDLVTSDFVRDLDLEIRADDTLSTDLAGCARRIQGTLSLSVHQDRGGVDENLVAICAL